MGKGTEVKSEPCRRSTKSFGAVSVEPDLHFHFRFAKTFNATTFLGFLKQIVRRNPGRKVFMALDNVGYHHAVMVQDWLKENADRIELFFLPAYSPDLNGVEHVWRLTKRKATHNVHFEELDDLHATVFRQFNRFQGNPASLRSPLRRWIEMVA